MKKKTVVKIVLDVLMLIVLSLMYSKNAINMAFHEIGGLAVIGAFVIHKLLNWDWIKSVSAKLFNKKTLPRARFMYLVDFLMLLSFLSIGVSGVLISHTLFDFGLRGSMVLKVLHYTGSALALILLGVHLGLHLNYLSGIFSRLIRLPAAAKRAAAVVLTVALVGFGCYSMATTSFARWLTMPFTLSSPPAGGERKREAALSEPDAALSEPDAAAEAAETAEAQEKRPEGGKGRGEKAQIANPYRAILVFLQYFSIAFVFAALTAFIARLTGKKRKG